MKLSKFRTAVAKTRKAMEADATKTALEAAVEACTALQIPVQWALPVASTAPAKDFAAKDDTEQNGGG